MKLNLSQAFLDIKTQLNEQKEHKRLNELFSHISVFNKTIKVNLEFKSKAHALEISKILNSAISNRYDGAFIVNMMYYDYSRELQSLTLQYQKAFRAKDINEENSMRCSCEDDENY